MDTHLLSIASKTIKCLGIKLTKERKDLYNKNFLSEESDLEDTRKGKDFSYSWVGRAKSEDEHPTKYNLQSQCSPNQNTIKRHPKILTESKKTGFKFAQGNSCLEDSNHVCICIYVTLTVWLTDKKGRSRMFLG